MHVVWPLAYFSFSILFSGKIHYIVGVNKFNTLRSLPLKLNTLCSHFTSDIDAKGFINYLCLLWISQMLLVSCYWRIFSVLNCCFEPTFIAFTQRCLDIVQSLHKPVCVQRVSWTETAFRLLCSKTLTSFLYSNNKYRFFFLYEYIDTDADFYAFEQHTSGKWKVREK